MVSEKNAPADAMAHTRNHTWECDMALARKGTTAVIV